MLLADANTTLSHPLGHVVGCDELSDRSEQEATNEPDDSSTDERDDGPEQCLKDHAYSLSGSRRISQPDPPKRVSYDVVVPTCLSSLRATR